MFVVSAKPLYLITTLLLLFLGFSLGAWTQLIQCGNVLLRLKWLFLSIFLIYLFLTPGQDIFPLQFFSGFPLGSLVNSLLTDLITIEGLYLGSLRVCSLVILILAVNLFIQAKQHTELSYAIIWLLSPLKYVGFPVDRLAIRISLTFKYVAEFQHSLLTKDLGLSSRGRTNPLQSKRPNQKMSLHGSLLLAIDKSVVLLEDVLSRLNEAEYEDELMSTPVERQHPSVLQWLLPIGLLGVYLSLLA